MPDWIVLASLGVLIGLAFLFFPSDGSSSYNQLRESCALALREAQRIETVKAWLKANKFPYQLKKTPPIRTAYGETLDDVLLYNLWQLGLQRDDVERSESYISFGEFPVRWGGGVRGYFLFSADGALIDYRLDRNNHPL